MPKIPDGYVVVADWAEGSTSEDGRTPLTGVCPMAGTEKRLKTPAAATAALRDVEVRVADHNTRYARSRLTNPRVLHNADSPFYRAKCWTR